MAHSSDLDGNFMNSTIFQITYLSPAQTTIYHGQFWFSLSRGFKSVIQRHPVIIQLFYNCASERLQYLQTMLSSFARKLNISVCFKFLFSYLESCNIAWVRGLTRFSLHTPKIIFIGVFCI